MKDGNQSNFEFWKILKGVSRSFYLTLILLPKETRKEVALAYMLARSADTLADSPLIIKNKRLKYLRLFRDCLHIKLTKKELTPIEKELIDYFIDISKSMAYEGRLKYEKELLLHIKDIFQIYLELPSSKRKIIYSVLDVIIQGMEFDLTRFSWKDRGEIKALKDKAELEQYCYNVAGVVGKFWTEIHGSSIASLKKFYNADRCKEGIAFGKALQMTNILRDISEDLSRGRCYLPREDMAQWGIKPADCLQVINGKILEPYFHQLLKITFHYYLQGITYLFSIPTKHFRLRLSCALPLLIGLKTIGLLTRRRNLLLKEKIKIKRKEVYILLIQCVFTLFSKSMTRNLFYKVIRKEKLRHLL